MGFFVKNRFPIAERPAPQEKENVEKHLMLKIHKQKRNLKREI